MEHDTLEQPKSHGSVTPKIVAADILVSIIILSGAWVLEWLKARFTHGVPMVVTASIGVSELTMLVYFIRSLVRAITWAYKEIDTSIADVQAGVIWKYSGQILSASWRSIKEARPAIKHMRSTIAWLGRILFIAFTIFISYVIVESIKLEASDKSPYSISDLNVTKFAVNLGNSSVLIWTSSAILIISIVLFISAQISRGITYREKVSNTA